MHSAETLDAIGRSGLPGLLGIRITAAGDGWIEGELAVRAELMAPNGYLHAGSVVTLADTLCGYGCVNALPEGASGFTTIELKSNFLGTARDGLITGRASLVHGGRSTQLWDAVVRNPATGRDIALFRCTQMVLWPKPA